MIQRSPSNATAGAQARVPKSQTRPCSSKPPAASEAPEPWQNQRSACGSMSTVGLVMPKTCQRPSWARTTQWSFT